MIKNLFHIYDLNFETRMNYWTLIKLFLVVLLLSDRTSLQVLIFAASGFAASGITSLQVVMFFRGCKNVIAEKGFGADGHIRHSPSSF